MSLHTTPSQPPSPIKRVFAQVLAIIAALSAIIGVLSFITGWGNLRAMMSAMWPREGSSTKSVARVVDLSPFVESLPAREFRVPRGGVVGDFEFANSGDVSYRGAPFRPRVHFTPDDTPEVLISVPPFGAVAAVVGLDIDGQRSFFLVHLDERRGIFCKAPARDLYWSPDQRHLLTLNVYEGQYFSTVDTVTDAFRSSDFLAHDGTLWYVEGRPKWSTDGRVFYAKAVVTQNEYETSDPQKAADQTPLDTFLISVDVESLAVTVHD